MSCWLLVPPPLRPPSLALVPQALAQLVARYRLPGLSLSPAPCHATELPPAAARRPPGCLPPWPLCGVGLQAAERLLRPFRAVAPWVLRAAALPLVAPSRLL